MAALLIQIDAYDPVGAAAVTLRIASENDDRLCHLNSQTWWPALQTAPIFSYDYFDGSFAGSIETPSSSIAVSIDPWPNFARYIFGDARVQIWTGTLGAAWGSYTLRFDGQVTAQPEISQGIATIAFKVDDRWLDTPLLTTLLGTGGVEGPAEMLGVPRPLMLGRPRYAPGLMVDSVNNVLMLSGYGLIEDVEVAMEALAQFGPSVGDFADYAALVAASIPAGKWGTCKASGLVRHGAPPYGKLSYMVKGDKAGPDGWARLPGQLIRRIALLAGGSGRISDTSLNALDAARPYNVSLVVTEQTTARDLIQKIAASVNAVAGISWTGNLWARPVGIGSSARTLASDGSSLPPVAKVDQIAVAAPFWRLAIEAEKTWSVHAQSEVFYVDPGGTVRFPSLPPADWNLGGIYIDQTGKQFRFEGLPTLSNGAAVTSNGAAVTDSGYTDVQDAAIAQAAITANWSTVTGTGRPQDNADVTAQSVPSLTVPATLTITADYLGAVTDSLPIDLECTRLLGTTNVDDSTTWSATFPAGVTGTIDTTSAGSLRGNIAITAATGSGALGDIVVTATRDGVTLTNRIAVTKNNAPAPSGGGSGATSATITSYTDASSASYGSANGGPVTVAAPASGKVTVSGSLSYRCTPKSTGVGYYGMAIKAQCDGVDIATEVVSTAEAQIVDEGDGFLLSYAGTITFSFEKTGLVSGTDHTFQVLARRAGTNSTLGSRTITGTTNVNQT